MSTSAPMGASSGATINHLVLKVRDIEASHRFYTEIIGFEGRIVWDTSMPNGQPRRSLDASRARELFGFEARTSLHEGLERTVAWYRQRVGAAAGGAR